MPHNLTHIAANQEQAMIRAFTQVLGDIRGNATLDELTRLIEAGNIDAIPDALQLDRTTWQPLAERIRQAYLDGGVTGAEQIGRIAREVGTLVMRFDIRAIRAEQWLQAESSRLITEIVEDQRTMVRERLTEALARGESPRQSALDLIGRINRATRKREGGFIGSTSRQASWIANARAELEDLNPNYFNRALRDKRFDGRVRKAIKDGEPLKKQEIDSAINRMQARTQRYRGQVISRTESINALRAGQFEAMKQAVEKAEVRAQDVKKVWDSSSDARTRIDHLNMEQIYREGIPLDEPFIAPDMSRLMYPGDSSLGASGDQTIQCRCKARYEIDFLGQLKRIEGFN